MTSVPGEQIFIGLMTAALCGAGMSAEVWFLTETRKGRKLVNVCGAKNSLWIVRGVFTAGIIFGLLLATGIVNPVQW